jgi:hypothetical protein
VNGLKPVEEQRLKNLLELQSRTGRYGAPTAVHLAATLSEHGAKVTPSHLTAIYQKTKPVSRSFASQVERALSLPEGWLSEDHEFLFTLAPFDLSVHRALALLPADAKASISSLVLQLSKTE